MLKTGLDPKDGKTFQRQLLSDYLPHLGMDRFVDYISLKGIIAQATNPAASSEDVAAYCSQFFALLKDSFVRVKQQLHDLESRAVRLEHELQEASAEDLRGSKEHLLFDAYTLLHTIDRYRQLNIAGFAKVLGKFFKRLAKSSVELQEKIYRADDIISKSIVSVPMYATGHAKELVAALYSVTHGMTLEQSILVLEHSISSNPNFARRIVALTDAHFYKERAKHQQLQGTFAAKILCGTSNNTLAKHIAAVMRSSGTVAASLGRFANGEVSISIKEAIRADDVYVVQSMAATAAGSMSTAIMELLLTLQASQLSSCARLTAVIPYMAYSKRTQEVAAIAEMLELMGCTRVITIDLFAEQVEGMFNIPVDNISARDEFAHYLLRMLRERGDSMTNLIVVSPNADNVSRARAFADRLMKLGHLDPETQFISVASALRKADAAIDVAGSVEGKHCIIVDNVCDEAYNDCCVADRLSELGAVRCTLLATHALFSGDAPSRIKASALDEVIVSDSVNRDELLADAELALKLRILPVAPLLAGVIDRVHSNINAVSELLEK